MKRGAFGIPAILVVASSMFASCSGCTDPVGTDGTPDNNGESNNGGGNNDGSCLLGSQCASGVCENGVCAAVTPNNDVCDEPGPCGNCDPFCRRSSSGAGTSDPFQLDSDTEESEGVVLSPEGAITIDSRYIENHFIWISNTGEGTISKVDTRTMQEVARYYSGPDGQQNDPSRTSVNTYGDVFVGNRSGRSVTKISGAGLDCIDTNADGVVTTSTGPNDLLAWGQDDCVQWNQRLPDGGIIRAVAAQDARPDDDTAQPAVWIGGWDGVAWKLSADRGDILVQTPSPVPNYGFALDGLGNLWISGWTDEAIGRIDTARCTTTADCAVPTCNGEDQDNCIKQRIPMTGGDRTYGITVDFKQRVWAGGDATFRYDPSAAVGSRMTKVPVPFVHGIAADDKGFIWGAAMTNGIIRFDAENPASNIVVAGSEGASAKGMAVDLDGKIWTINQSHSNATVVTPGAALADYTVQPGVAAFLVSPYTYSDMTGAQLRFATDERGYYRKVFDGCPTDGTFKPTEWQEIRWDADTPGDATIAIRLRGAPSRQELATAPWVDVATIPPDRSPMDIQALVEAAGLQGMNVVEIEAHLEAVRNVGAEPDSPVLRSLEVTFACERNVQ